MNGRFAGARRAITIVAMLALLGAGALVFVSPVFAATEEDVTRNHDADWHVRETRCSGLTATGSQGFEPGPVGQPTTSQEESELPPRGNGSLRLATGPNGDSLEELRNTRYGGRTLSELTELDYWTYVTSAPPALPGGYIPAVYLKFDLDLNGDSRFDDSLVFEPAYQTGQLSVRPGVWQHWFGRGGIWYRASIPSVRRTFAEWLNDPQFATAKIINTDLGGGVVLAAGCGGEEWAGFVGHADGVTIGFQGDLDSIAYDMDPPTPNEPRRLNCEPETAINQTGSSHRITCTVRTDQDVPVEDVQVSAEASGANDPDDGNTPQTPDFNTCFTTEDGTCSFTHGGASGTSEAGKTTYRAWIDIDGKPVTVEADPTEGRDERSQPGARPETTEAPDDTDVVEKNWTASQLQCDPESASAPSGTAHTIICVARNSAGATVAGTAVDMEATGVNDPDNNAALSSPDFSCVTDANGACSMVHGPGGKGTTGTTGKTTYRAWIDADGSNANPEADTTEGRDEAITAGTRREPDDTDVMEMAWTTGGATPTPTPTCASPAPSPTPTGASPSPTPTPCPTPTPTPTRSPTPTPTPSPTVSPHGCAGDPDAITGTSGNDVLRGTDGDDTICGFGGDDVIFGGGGNDRLLGGGGKDQVDGQAGHDMVSGGAGNDELWGRGGRDTLKGRGGNDQLTAARGNDELLGGAGDDLLDGGAGRDACAGGRGSDRLRRCE